MENLTPVGLSKDGKRLLLVSDAGEEFSCAHDHKLRTALRGDNDRLGQLEMKMNSALRPRDIQTRIRNGETPEAVAEAANTTVDAIMPYAGPVLAERAHVAQGALKSSVRRKSADAPTSARTLGEATEHLVREIGLHEEDLDWDAWRRVDGRWALTATFTVEGRERIAEFVYDLAGRYVVAENHEAKLLTGEARPRNSAATASGAKATGRRLSAVPPADDELPLGDDAIEMVRTGNSETETAAAWDDPTADHADADWIAEEPAPAHDEDLEPAAAEAPTTQPGESEEPTSEEPVTEASEAAEGEPRSRQRRKGRASVPSWDEIMFGGGKAE